MQLTEKNKIISEFIIRYNAFVIGIIQSNIRGRADIDAMELAFVFFEEKMLGGKLISIIENTEIKGLGYLRVSIQNFIIDFYRKDAKKGNQPNKVSIVDDEVFLNKLADDKELNKENKEKIDKIKKLFKGTRLKVFELWSEGCSNAVIAKKVNIKIKSVEQHKYHIKKKAKEEFGQNHFRKGKKSS